LHTYVASREIGCGEDLRVVAQDGILASRMRGIVRTIADNIVVVELPGGFPGFITDTDMKRAGFEYADYHENLVSGAGLDVVVEKVFVARRKVRVNLSRNVAPVV
jgi:hypothetical protein